MLYAANPLPEGQYVVRLQALEEVQVHVLQEVFVVVAPWAAPAYAAV